MIRDTRFDGPFDGSKVYTPSFESMSLRQRRNLKRDIGWQYRTEGINVLSTAAACVIGFLMFFPGLPLLLINGIAIPILALASLLLVVGVVWGALRLDARESAPVGAAFRIDDARWNELRRALQDCTLYSGEPAWGRFNDVMRGKQETPLSTMLDTYVIEYMDSMRHHPDMLTRLEAHTAGNDEITRKWIQHQEELEKAAANCADLVTQIIDEHDFPAAQKSFAIPELPASVLQDEDVEWLQGVSAVVNQSFFTPQGQNTLA